MIYFRLYIEGYEGDTRDLSMLEDGAYNRLLRHYYATERPLPRDVDSIFELARAVRTDAQAAIRTVLARYFDLRKDGYHNARADAEIAAAASARANGARGGRPPKSAGGQVGGQTRDETQTVTGPITGSETGTGTGEITETQTADVTQKVTGSGQPNKPTSTSSSKPGGDNLDQGRARTRRSAPRGASKGNGEDLAARNARAAAEAAEEAMRDFDEPKPKGHDAAPPQRAESHRARARGEASPPAAAAPPPPDAEPDPLPDDDELDRPAGPRDGAEVREDGEEADERAWWRDEDGILAMGGEMAVVAIEGEPFDEFKCRVLAAKGAGPWMDELTVREAERVGYYQAFGYNPPADDSVKWVETEIGRYQAPRVR